MTTTELKERYIYAATKRLPRKTRADIAKELEGLLDDMLAERCGEEEPTEKDLRVIFAEIGQPAELHRKYSPSAETVLLGPPYYEPYLFVLKIVLGCMLLGLTIAFIMNLTANPGEPVKAVFGWLFSLASGGCGAFTFLTLLFTFFSRRGIDLKDFDDEINNLAPVPKGSHKIPKWECIAGIMLGIAFALVLLAAPDLIRLVTQDGTVLPLFQPEVLRSGWFWILCFTAAGIARECVALMDGRYTRRVLLSTLIADGVSFVCALMLFGGAGLVNGAALTAVLNDGYESGHVLTWIVAHFNLLMLVIFTLILAADAIEALYKYYRYEKHA